MSDNLDVGGTRYDLCGFCRTKITDEDVVGLIKSVPYHASCKNEHLEGLKGVEQVSSDLKGASKEGALEVVSLYDCVEFEPRACRQFFSREKMRLTFDKSLERLRAAGFQRHARPQESFGLLIEGLEGLLTGGLSEVRDDMLAGDGEWLSLAFERKGDLLVCYLDPAGLVWNGSRYVKQNFSHAGESTFNIKGIRSGQWVRLDKFKPDFAQLLYGRPFNQLPAELRRENYTVRVEFPLDGITWPVARDGFYGYDVSGYNRSNRASRGVRQKNLQPANIQEKKGLLKRFFGWS